MRNKYGELRIVQQVVRAVMNDDKISDVLTSEQLKQLEDFISKNAKYIGDQLFLEKELSFFIVSGDTGRNHILRFAGVLDDNETLIFGDLWYNTGSSLENITLSININNVSEGTFTYNEFVGGE